MKPKRDDIVRYNADELELMRLQKEKEEMEDNSFLNRYATIAFRDIGRLVDQVFGNRYQPINHFALLQKQKILDYIFTKNVIESVELTNNRPKRQFRQVAYPQPRNTKERLNVQKKRLEESNDKISGLQSMRKGLRCYFVNETAYEFNRSRYVSMAYGFIIAAAINITLMKFSTITRKAFLAITLSHIFGQVSVYRNMDFVFDQLYTLFKHDAKAAIAEGRADMLGGKELQQIIKTLEL